MIDQRYDEGARGNDCPYSWLNEWLCEYVDGTMDPSVRAVFEEYLKANPELAEHVEQLCRTRSLLCECERRRRVTPDVSGLHSRLREQAADEKQMPAWSVLAGHNRFSVAATAGSAVLALAVGMMIGATFFAAEPPSARRVADRTAAPSVHVERSAEAPSQTPPPGRSSFMRRTAPASLTRMPALQLIGQRRVTGPVFLSAADSMSNVR